MRLASAASGSVFALGIALLGGCDFDSNSHLIAPADIPVLTGDTIPCPHSALTGCESTDFSEDNPWLSALQDWYGTIEGPTSACTAAFNELETALGSLTIFTFGNDTGDPTNPGATIRDSQGNNVAIGLRTGSGFGIASDGSVADATLVAQTLLHEGYHLLGADDIDTYFPGPGNALSACQNYDPPV